MSIDLAHSHQIISDDFRPIATAPKDGTLIIVAHEDCGAFPMRWKTEGYNPLFSVREGLWEALDGSFTWVDHDDLGPSHWKPAAPAKQRSDALIEAKGKTGGATGLARLLANISPQAVSQWRRVPAERVLEVERVSGVPRHRLRPDIYPQPEQVTA